MLRGDLKIIYDTLEDADKHRWAARAEYKSREGLYSYLRIKHDTHAYDKLVAALVETIGKERFVKYTKEINTKITMDEHKLEIIKLILSSNSKDTIENILTDITMACESQLLRIKVESTIK